MVHANQFLLGQAVDQEYKIKKDRVKMVRDQLFAPQMIQCKLFHVNKQEQNFKTVQKSLESGSWKENVFQRENWIHVDQGYKD